LAEAGGPEENRCSRRLRTARESAIVRFNRYWRAG
jgi:hypothetical protein